MFEESQARVVRFQNAFVMTRTDWGFEFQQFMLHPSYLGAFITALYALLGVYVFAMGKQHNSNDQQRRELRILAQVEKS